MISLLTYKAIEVRTGAWVYGSSYMKHYNKVRDELDIFLHGGPNYTWLVHNGTVCISVPTYQDKGEMPLYEYDVVTIKDGQACVVKFDTHFAQFVARNIKGGRKMALTDLGEFEIVGNAHGPLLFASLLHDKSTVCYGENIFYHEGGYYINGNCVNPETMFMFNGALYCFAEKTEENEFLFQNETLGRKFSLTMKPSLMLGPVPPQRGGNLA